MAKILNPLDVVTVNVEPASAYNASEGWAVNLNTRALATTDGATVAVGILMLNIEDGKPAYGQSTGLNAECAIGRALVRITSADVHSAEDFNTTNYAVGAALGFTGGKYDYNATSKRGVVVNVKTTPGSPVTVEYVDVIVDKVLG